ncbi:BQ2448_6001 [Microbotryum intermedium]|uniref:BQ2448_6001 protein n=1 Tax=Microbotryum intermedium TaxID=269621 RepID=A0A238F2W7_9BASI|nr:BQ2448_6001 [Microbotryum intermedium]
MAGPINCSQGKMAIPIDSRYKLQESYSSPVSRCKIDQRNGASAPEAQLAASLQTSLAKIFGKPNYTSSDMEFLGKYKYNLGSDGALYPTGATQTMRARTSTTHLAPQCPNLVSSAPTAQQQWRDVWTPAVIQRLQSGGNSYGLNSTDIINFAYMCALDSFAHASTSPFWSKIYAQKDRTIVNKTTDSSPHSFPLDHALYADLASEDQILAVMSLLNHFLDASLSTTAQCPMRSFITSKMTVPFAGRLAFELLSCTGNGFRASLKQTMGASLSDYVRVVVNGEAMDVRHICKETGRSRRFPSARFKLIH